jgi:predicted component of type VI protein secretion system
MTETMHPGDGDRVEAFGGLALPVRDGAVMGRSPLADLCLPDPSVSRQHARLLGEPGRWLLEDLHSRNGTWVGDRKLQTGGACPLRHGDAVRLGNVVVRVWLPSEEALDTTSVLSGAALRTRLHLTAYQFDVLRMLCSEDEPLSNAQIAERLGTPLAVDAVKAALSRIYARAGLAHEASPGKRRELCRRAHAEGWLS